MECRTRRSVANGADSADLIRSPRAFLCFWSDICGAQGCQNKCLRLSLHCMIDVMS